ncbi:MAG: BON domain-containing protein [Planctomycetes bacterium]|nr:BON domain-containing protein [Planctomycetota bacterium]
MLQAIDSNTDDRVIARSARECLEERLREMVRDLECESHRGVLVLRGKAKSFYHKQLAQETVRALEGVLRVINNIEVVRCS